MLKVKVVLVLVILGSFLPGRPAEASTGAPAGSHCPQLYSVVVNNWSNGRSQWRKLDAIIFRESRCRPGVVNSIGCVGLMQICSGNHRRLGVTASALRNPAINIRTGYKLCRESMRHHKSCWQPWSIGR